MNNKAIVLLKTGPAGRVARYFFTKKAKPQEIGMYLLRPYVQDVTQGHLKRC